MTQTEIILEMLKTGPVTVPMARAHAKCERLAARINDLRRAGHQIITERFTTPGGANVARYVMKASIASHGTASQGTA